MASVDLIFPCKGTAVPMDHGYPLFAALSARLPAIHERTDIGVFNLRGTLGPAGVLDISAGSLRVRCSTDALGLVLPLTGAELQLAGNVLRLGIPKVLPLRGPPSLTAKLVTFKHALEEEPFRVAASKFLRELGCDGKVHIGRRRIVTIAGKKVVGFALTVSELTPQHSLLLQEKGLGGRRHMGCGLFLPARLHMPLREPTRPPEQAQ